MRQTSCYSTSDISDPSDIENDDWLIQLNESQALGNEHELTQQHTPESELINKQNAAVFTTRYQSAARRTKASWHQ